MPTSSIILWWNCTFHHRWGMSQPQFHLSWSAHCKAMIESERLRRNEPFGGGGPLRSSAVGCWKSRNVYRIFCSYQFSQHQASRDGLFRWKGWIYRHTHEIPWRVDSYFGMVRIPIGHPWRHLLPSIWCHHAARSWFWAEFQFLETTGLKATPGLGGKNGSFAVIFFSNQIWGKLDSLEANHCGIIGLRTWKEVH